jgi:chemotaxis response regulator CheB
MVSLRVELTLLRVTEMAFVLCGASVFAGLAAAQETQRGQLNARELFYSAVQTPAAAPQASPPAKAVAKTTVKKASPPATTQAPRTETPSPSAAQASTSPHASQPVLQAASTGGAKVISRFR